MQLACTRDNNETKYEHCRSEYSAFASRKLIDWSISFFRVILTVGRTQGCIKEFILPNCQTLDLITDAEYVAIAKMSVYECATVQFITWVCYTRITTFFLLIS